MPRRAKVVGVKQDLRETCEYLAPELIKLPEGAKVGWDRARKADHAYSSKARLEKCFEEFDRMEER